jgi:hypothetical protein
MMNWLETRQVRQMHVPVLPVFMVKHVHLNVLALLLMHAQETVSVTKGY